MPRIPEAVAIVGSEAAKFTELGRGRALKVIRAIVSTREPCQVVSGGCHLGGVDIWAEEVSRELNQGLLVFLPKTHTWGAGYKERNLLIAQTCDVIHVITVYELPNDFLGMTFRYCYHCLGKNRPIHVKSGACWTANQAIALGKPAYWHVIENY